MSDFWKGLLATAVPVVTLIVFGTSGSQNNQSWSSTLWALVWVSLFVAFVAAILFGVKRRKRVSAGIFVGLAIGVVALGVSCFALIGSSLGG